MSIINTTPRNLDPDTATIEPQPDAAPVEPDEAQQPDAIGEPDEGQPPTVRPVLLFVDPTTVKVEVNVRKTPKVSREFVASVKRHGVLIAMRGYFDQYGDPVIRDGQRRILACQKADVHEAPALVYPSRDALVDAVAAERERIIEQVGANSHREDLSELDEADAIQQLALSGLEPTVIAKALSVKPARVTSALTVAASGTGRKVVEHGVTLDQAAVIAEFEDDPKAVKTLTDTARYNASQFAHEAQRIRDRKAAESEQQQYVDDLTARGIPVVDAPDGNDRREANAFLHELQDADGKALVVDEWVGKPGYAVALRTRWGAWSPSHVILDWRSRGLRRKSSGGAVTGKMTEAEKAARREVVQNNKEWDSAEKVRREWLATLLSRKALPKDADQFVAYMLAERGYAFEKALHSGLVATILGIKPEPGAVAKYLTANPAKARTVTLAFALAAGEGAMDRGSWRSPTGSDRVFLNWLVAWGYTLSRVEAIIARPPQASKPKRTRRKPAAPASSTAAAEQPKASADAPQVDSAEDETETAEDVEQVEEQVEPHTEEAEPSPAADDHALVEADIA